jgi:hypothetical protein
MAPELAEHGTADVRSDLYALGASFYELAVGRPPFTGTPTRIRMQHLSAPPPHPAARRSSIPDTLDALIVSLLAKKPTDRPEDVREVLRILSELYRETAAGEDVAAMITDGEGQHTEFKQTFRAPATEHEIRHESVSAAYALVEKQCAKAVAGFMNADGGTLLVGVRDDGEIVGIEPDFETMQPMHADQPMRDLWSLRFLESMKKYLGPIPAAVSTSFVGIDYRTVALVKCHRDPSPNGTWLREGDAVHRFYVRTGSKTDELAPPDAVAYLAGRN